MSAAPIHPGQYVRQTYLEPRRLTVTDAANLIGISRPGVSNFLNGKVSVTENIAARIERAFGIPKADLIAKQAEYDAAIASHASVPANTKTYVPLSLAFVPMRSRTGPITTSPPAFASPSSCAPSYTRRA
jgi:addiction module HigA family antidote